MGISLEDIKNAMNNLINLDIRTIVGEVDFDSKGKMQPTANSKQMVSRLNLLDGDITTAFPEDFLQMPLDSVRSFHALRERQAMEIVQGNIRALQHLVGLIDTLDRQEKADKNDHKPRVETPPTQPI
ncbi:MAG: hypothetical protein RIT27_458 [Pseudomonadota bacterium]|jgi:hypothetical protein